MAQLVKNLPVMWKTWVWSLGWEDLLQKGMATHSSILAWRIPRTVQIMQSQRVRHDWVTFTSVHTICSLSNFNLIFCLFFPLLLLLFFFFFGFGLAISKSLLWTHQKDSLQTRITQTKTCNKALEYIGILFCFSLYTHYSLVDILLDHSM